jgi:hypothetical protein
MTKILLIAVTNQWEQMIGMRQVQEVDAGVMAEVGRAVAGGERVETRATWVIGKRADPALRERINSTMHVRLHPKRYGHLRLSRIFLNGIPNSREP